MKRRSLLFALLIAAVCGGVAATAGQPEGIREVKVVQVNGNPRMVSRLFPLKHQTAQDLFPFVESAILRYNANSRLKSVNCTGGRGIAFLVTTGEDRGFRYGAYRLQSAIPGGGSIQRDH